MAESSAVGDIPATDQACFDGFVLAVLAYGVLLMLCIQVTQALLSRPKRGRVFFGIVIYSSILFLLTTIAVGGKAKFAEMVYVVHRDYPAGVEAYERENSGQWVNVMSQICTTLIPWFGDLFMMYRMMVVWNYEWWLLFIPLPIYMARLGMSLLVMIAQTQPNSTRWAAHVSTYNLTLYVLCISLSFIFTILIALRLHTLRGTVEKVMGKLQASFYTSGTTIFVESGAFLTLWSFCYMVTLASNSWAQDIFLKPYPYIVTITCMLIALRMSQDCAWTWDITVATASGVLEWKVSSTRSIGLRRESDDGSIAYGHNSNNFEKSFSEEISTTGSH
ncbi:uncharacterized protein LACBIDRAFT_324894 [Laccaria bicolor S238N-H82]|uniref:Predicted protein n=1 Tax=Laccaria bicolor (strain S238N-H82 / ATCC MYA-4686) TaxID=486041 RepID=B0D3E1_LACBS|nr:uncharacterized protein LACBIDRAFT_324894 [Laccaria bicolor S238N-H82]EDR11264.1 predicted protein [Laccaria bicolor S238N-H82]|eukprot:XP_001878565.1 predicted protein [Laccaria bicolor S238N-H82]